MTPSVLISGASSGIGEATTRSLAKEGWTVFAGVRSEQDARRLKGRHLSIRPVLLDVTCKESIAHAIGEVSSCVGDRGLSGLVNNAGIGYIAPVEHIAVEDFKHNFDVNVFGLLALTQASLPLLKKGETGGRIVNIGSIAGLCKLPYVASYHASKHALEALSDAMRMELSPEGIAVSLIRPGPISTSIFQKAADFASNLINEKGTNMSSSCRTGLRSMMRTAVRTGANARDTEPVVQVIKRALTEKNPQAYYFDSWETAVLVQFLSWAPTPLLDRTYDRAFHTAQH